MEFTHIKLLTLALVLFTSVGCATVPSQTIVATDPSAEAASLLGTAVPGSTVELTRNNQLGLSNVVVGRIYHAASGRECRKLFSTGGAPLTRVSCKGQNGEWQFARDLQPGTPAFASVRQLNQSSEALDTANAEPIIIIEPMSESGNESAVESTRSDAVDLNAALSTERTLLADETLWSFAKRTTGNAYNWQKIAELNGVTDANTLAAGTRLIIPVELVSQGD